MKITAEFNSNEELISFINTFSDKDKAVVEFEAKYGASNLKEIKIVSPMVDKEDKPVEEIKAPREDISENVATIDAEIKDEAPKADKKEEVKVTKEMIRERLGAIMKSGKQKEVKDLVAAHGAGKLPDLEEKEYAAVYKEAEGLI